ncbi:unnamed protein product, partial [Durusdinium trenchii]
AADGGQLVGFGKHSALSYEELLKAEPQYCSWVKTKYANQVEAGEGMTPQFRALGSYLQGVQVPSAPMRSPAGKAQTGFNKAAQVQAAKAAQAAQSHGQEPNTDSANLPAEKGCFAPILKHRVLRVLY